MYMYYKEVFFYASGDRINELPQGRFIGGISSLHIIYHRDPSDYLYATNSISFRYECQTWIESN